MDLRQDEALNFNALSLVTSSVEVLEAQFTECSSRVLEKQLLPGTDFKF